MATRSGGARARGLGAEIRKIRDSLDRSLESLVEPVGLSIATLSRIENGQRVCKPDELISILTVLGVTGKERERLVHLARGSTGLSWLGLGKELAQQFTALTAYEDEAVGIFSVQPLMIPGLLQTTSYARTLFQSGDGNDVESAIRRRQRRQSNLTRPTLMCYLAILDESVIRRPIGGPEIMAEQLSHLLMVSELSQVEIRIAPFDHGLYRGLDGGFHLFEFARQDRVAYFEAQASGVFFEGPETEHFKSALDNATVHSLGPKESIELMRQYHNKWESG